MAWGFEVWTADRIDAESLDFLRAGELGSLLS